MDVSIYSPGIGMESRTHCFSFLAFMTQEKVESGWLFRNVMTGYVLYKGITAFFYLPFSGSVAKSFTF